MVLLEYGAKGVLVPALVLAAVAVFCAVLILTGNAHLGILVISSLGLIALGFLSSSLSSRRKTNNLTEQLFQSQKLAALGEIAAGVAHEINNPLAVIGQEAELMLYHVRNEELSRDELKEGLVEIVSQVERCGGITGKMLEFARKPERVSQGVDLNELVEGVVKLVQMEATRKDVKITRNYHLGGMMVKVDAPLLRQVVLNILNNALQAVGDKGRIIIATRLSGSLAEVVVSDNGPGFPKEVGENLFTPFYTTKAPGEGTGLGLSISLRVMDEIGGTIRAESSKGKGATFIISFPARTGEL